MDTDEMSTAATDTLKRMQAGTAVTGEVAKLAAEVLANPPKLMVAARRYLTAVGSEHEAAAAVAFLELLVKDGSDRGVVSASGS